MQQSIPIQTSRPSRHILLSAALVTLVGGMYLYLTSQKSKPLPLSAHLEKAIGIEASMEVYEEAIAYAVKNLAVELGIDLENYDLSTEDYRAIVEAAASKFSNCHQYKLFEMI